MWSIFRLNLIYTPVSRVWRILYGVVTEWVYTSSVRKVSRLCSQKLYFEIQQKLSPLAFKVFPPESNTLPHPLLSCIHALLEGFFKNLKELRRHGLLDSFHIRKMSLFDDFLKLGEQKKSQGARSGE